MSARPRWTLITLVILMGLVMVACGGQTPQPDEGEETAEVEETAEPTATPLPPTEEPTPTPTLEPTKPPEATPTLPPADRIAALGSVTEEDVALYERLLTTVIPENDPVAAAIALQGVDPASIPDWPTEPTRECRVGDTEMFWVHKSDVQDFNQVEAELIYVSKHAYFWQDKAFQAVNRSGAPASAADWKAAGDSFDASYEAVRAVFGLEASPGVDGDVRVHVVHSDLGGNVAGYVGSLDSLPTVVEEHSTVREIFFMDAANFGVGVGGDIYNETLAHEFQHMIHDYIDPSEDGWLNEGLSELAVKIALGGDSSWIANYPPNTDNPLWYWTGSEDYGYAYLFSAYLWERFGNDFITQLVANPTNSFAGIDETLAAVGYDGTFEDIFNDFMVAVFLDDTSIQGGIYGFQDVGIGTVEAAEGFRSLPAAYTDDVNQFGFDALRVRGEGQATLTFTGAQTAMLIPADASTGTHFWWSNRTDTGWSTLTREVDLSGVDSAMLGYWTWFDIEGNWDYAYVLVSTDGGATWVPQRSTSSKETDPNAQNYGFGLTGHSGPHREAVWVYEQVDLSAYAGQTILLRFAMVTDAVANENGIAIDDVWIDEIGWHDDMESGEGDWTAEGFVLIHNRVPQRWSVRVALVSDAGTTIQDVEIVEGAGTLDIDFSRVTVLVVFGSAQARFTTQPAPYTVEIVSK